MKVWEGKGRKVDGRINLEFMPILIGSPGSALLVHVMPSSHRRRGQDKTVLSCPHLRCEMSSRQSPTVFSRPEYIGD